MSRPGDAFAGYLRNPAFGGGAAGPAAQHLGRMGRFSGPGLLSAGRGAFRLHRHFPYPERPSRAAKALWAGHPKTLPAFHPSVASDPDGESRQLSYGMDTPRHPSAFVAFSHLYTPP